jgi:acyl transferase domain-containing protein
MLCAAEGSERAGMGRRLYETVTVFREIVDRCGEEVRADLCAPDGGRDLPPERAHPAVFAFEAALCSAWRSWGIDPAVLHGRGVGEYVAAWAAGLLELDDALRLVRERARALERANGGIPDAMALERLARTVPFGVPQADLLPAMAGAQAADMAEPCYWVRQLKAGPGAAEPVPGLLAEPTSLLVDVGPPPCPPGARNEDEWRGLMSRLAVLYAAGVEIDWRGVHRDRAHRRVLLPTYPFQRQRHWMDAPPVRSA